MIAHQSAASARDFLSTVAAEKTSIWCEICVSVSVFLSVSSVSVSVSFICLCIEDRRVQNPAHVIIESRGASHLKKTTPICKMYVIVTLIHNRALVSTTKPRIFHKCVLVFCREHVDMSDG